MIRTAAILLILASRCVAQSKAVPVWVEVQPPSPGQTISLKVNCGTLSRYECAHFAKPTAVHVCDAPKSGADCAGAGMEFGVTLASATATDLTVTLVRSALTAGKGVQIEYGDGKVKSGWEPILPSAWQVQCCDFSDLLRIVAIIPVGVTPYMEAIGHDGMHKFCHEPGVNGSGANDWHWTFNASACRFEAGDTVSLSVEVYGKPIQLAKVKSDDSAKGQAPAEPVAPPVIATGNGSCAAPYIPTGPGPVDRVTVVLGCLPIDKDPALDLEFLVNNKPLDGIVNWVKTGTSPLTYRAKLPSDLQVGQSVKVIQNKPQQRDPDSPSQIVVAPPMPPATVFTVEEGATSVAGYAPGLSKVRVELVDGKAVKSQQDVPVDSTSSLFTANFATPLQAYQQLQVFGLSAAGFPSEACVPVEVQPGSLDWGRVRGYFTAGVVLSNNNSQFNLANANTFLSFNLDKEWLRRPAAFNKVNGGFRERIRFHTFFDAQLTAIPNGSTGSSSGSTIASLLSNSQAAGLQTGGYLPLIVSEWDHREKSYALYVAPIAKAGFYILTSAGSDANQAAETANHAGTFFPFYSYGLRLGHYREYHSWDGNLDRSRAPEQLSYVDFGIGKWANFEYLEPFNFTGASSGTCTVPAVDAASASCDLRLRLWRYSFEGLLVIPNTPLILGLSANVSAQHPKSSGAAYLSPPDDLRFLFGFRFDASKLTGLLSKFGGQ